MSEPLGRVLPYAEFDAASNMAVDQAILESVDAGGPTTLRLYGWSAPSLSLGYFQSAAQRHRHAASQSIDWVRRATGGGAIVHDCELTYSFAVPIRDRRLGAREDLYHQSHLAIAQLLSQFGVRAQFYRELAERAEQYSEPFLCFQRRTAEDLIVSGYKVLGSAQRRSRYALLQHGSLLLRASRAAPELPGVGDLTSCQLSVEHWSELIPEALLSTLGLRQWVAGELQTARTPAGHASGRRTVQRQRMVASALASGGSKQRWPCAVAAECVLGVSVETRKKYANLVPAGGMYSKNMV